MIKRSSFKPAWWLPGPHLQTMYPTLLRRPIPLDITTERLELPDGDFLDLVWTNNIDNKRPIVIMLHGISGSIHAHYVRGMLKQMVNAGWIGVLMHFRGCSGAPNRLPRCYHSGDTQDLAYTVELIRTRFPKQKLAAIGFSLGGSVLLKWLGETGDINPLAAAVAVSVPFEFEKAANQVNTGLARIYQWYMLRDIRNRLLKKYSAVNSPVPKQAILTARNFWEFDDKVTAPLHGFTDASDYYRRTSSRQFLRNIAIPTLIIHAADDPLMTKEVISTLKELSPNLTLEVSNRGGHLGFVAGNNPLNPRYWLEARIPAYFRDYLA